MLTLCLLDPGSSANLVSSEAGEKRDVDLGRGV